MSAVKLCKVCLPVNSCAKSEPCLSGAVIALRMISGYVYLLLMQSRPSHRWSPSSSCEGWRLYISSPGDVLPSGCRKLVRQSARFKGTLLHRDGGWSSLQDSSVSFVQWRQFFVYFSNLNWFTPFTLCWAFPFRFIPLGCRKRLNGSEVTITGRHLRTFLSKSSPLWPNKRPQKNRKTRIEMFPRGSYLISGLVPQLRSFVYQLRSSYTESSALSNPLVLEK